MISKPGLNDPSRVEDEYEAPRHFHISKIYYKSDAVRVITAAVAKMYRVHRNPFMTPFDRLYQRIIFKFAKGETKSIFWTRSEAKVFV